MNTIINNLPLISTACEYFDRQTSAAWRIRATLTNMGVWACNRMLWLEANDASPEQLHRQRIIVSTIRSWLHDCSCNALTLDLTPSAVRKTLGLEREVDAHADACRIAREKCLRTRSAAQFQTYYKSALELAEIRRQERERAVEGIANMLSDNGWVLEGQIFDSRGVETLYEHPTHVSDADLYDEDLCETEADKLADTIANALESMYVECESQLAGAITSSKIDKLSGFRRGIEQMFDIAGVDKKALAKRQVRLEAALAEQVEKLNASTADLEAQMQAQLAAMQAPVEPPAPAPKVKSAAERKAAREARLAAKQ